MTYEVSTALDFTTGAAAAGERALRQGHLPGVARHERRPAEGRPCESTATRNDRTLSRPWSSLRHVVPPRASTEHVPC